MHSLFEKLARSIEASHPLDESLRCFCNILSEKIPIEGAFIGKHLPQSQQILFMARSTLKESRLLHVCVPIAEPVQQYLNSSTRPEACILPLHNHPTLQGLNKSVIPVDRSYMEIRLRYENKPIAMLALYAVKNKHFEEKDKDIVFDVRKPLANAAAVHLWKKGLLEVSSQSTTNLQWEAEKNRNMAPTISPRMKKVMQQIQTIASLPTTVLLLGETGVGKEVLARHLHACSPWKNGPFIHVNCGALPEYLADAELFGYERGAYTGAIAQHAGFFEQAHGGTIFLDEIGELPLSLQARLLLTLQDKTISRLGGQKRIPLSFRVVAATNRNIHEMANAQQFRYDLLYRLNALTVQIPPLRERKEDIPLFIDYFMKKFSSALGLVDTPYLPQTIMRQWIAYNWPGNVREVANRIERMLIFGDLEDFVHIPYAASTQAEQLAASLDHNMRQHIEQVLKQTGGKVGGPGGAAELLRVNASTLRSRMKKLGIAYGRKHPPIHTV